MEFEFEIVTEVIRRAGHGRAPFYTWPDAVFDGQQRIVTPLQVKEMGYANLNSAQGSFRAAAEKRQLRAIIVVLTAHRNYPNGGLAIRALPGKPKTSRCTDARHEGPNPLPVAEFHKNRMRTSGLASACRACSNRARRERADRAAAREASQP